MTKNFFYEELSSKHLRKVLTMDALIEVVLSRKRTRLFVSFVTILDGAMAQDQRKSWIRTIYVLVIGLPKLLRISLFHSNLLHLIAFYYLAKPCYFVEAMEETTKNIVRFSKST